MDDPDVSRRQFFRGLAGDLLKVVGEVTGLAEQEPEAPGVFDLSEGDVMASPQKHEAVLSDVVGFLEQLGARKQEDGEGSPPAPLPEAKPAPAEQAEPGQA